MGLVMMAVAVPVKMIVVMIVIVVMMMLVFLIVVMVMIVSVVAMSVHVLFVNMLVRVWMMMVMPTRPVRVAYFVAGISPKKQIGAKAGYYQAGNRSQPRIQLLRNNVAGCIERHRTECIDSRGVRDGHDHAQQEGMVSGTFRSHQVGGHQGLAVSGL